jgi:hypothetical protein
VFGQADERPGGMADGAGDTEGPNSPMATHRVNVEVANGIQIDYVHSPKLLPGKVFA